jgi:hypothetical protein
VPVVAQVDGVRTVSLALDEQEWTALKAAVRAGTAELMLSCGMPGHLKTSPLGTRFFAHDPRAGCGAHGPESAAHLMAKQEIVNAVRATGWSAEPEVAGDGWIADVLAEHGSARVAFEEQWSRQTAEEYRARQQRYAEAGIRGAWSVRHKTSVPTTPDKNLPAFLLAGDGSAMTVSVNRTTMPLAEVVTRLLTKRDRVPRARQCRPVVHAGGVLSPGGLLEVRRRFPILGGRQRDDHQRMRQQRVALSAHRSLSSGPAGSRPCGPAGRAVRRDPDRDSPFSA